MLTLAKDTARHLHGLSHAMQLAVWLCHRSPDNVENLSRVNCVWVDGALPLHKAIISMSERLEFAPDHALTPSNYVNLDDL